MGGGIGLAEGIPARLTPREGRRFALPVGTAFLVFGGIAWWRDHHAVAAVLGSLGVLLLAAGAIVPAKLGPVYHAWMGLARAISKVTTPVFMGIVYFIVIFPVGLSMRLLGRNPILHRPTSGSYWFARNKPRGEMTDQF
jgi:hypothetical protein